MTRGALRVGLSLTVLLGFALGGRIEAGEAAGAAQSGNGVGHLGPASRALYDNDRLFNMLSGAARSRLELEYGRKPVVKPAAHPNAAPAVSETRQYPVPSGIVTHKLSRHPDAVSSTTAIANIVVNNPAMDTTAQDTQSETTIIRGAGTNLIAGFNDSGSYTGANDHFTGWSTSTNSGATWTDQGAIPEFGVGGDVGDPVMAKDTTTGKVYFQTLNFNTFDTINVFTSTNDGLTLTAGVVCTPGTAGTGDQMDKNWIAVDNIGGTGNGNVYSVNRDFAASAGRNGIMFWRSTDQGLTWGPNLGTRVDNDGTGSTQGAQVAVGTAHQVYVSYFQSGSIRFSLGTLAGGIVTFAAPVIVTTLNTTGINGDFGLNGGFRTNAFPQMKVNPVSGNIYIAYSDKNGADKADVFFTQSTDNGTTWSAGVKVNDDAGTNDNWQAALAVTPDGTHAFMAWEDRRIDPADNLIDRFGAIASIAGGVVTWGPNFRIGTQSYPVVIGQDPVINTVYMGDYDSADADNSFFYSTWGDNRDSDAAHAHEPNVYFAQVPVTGVVGNCIVTLDPPTLPDGVQGLPYAQTVVLTGGIAPITYAVTAGALPPGLSLNPATGDITGTPTTSTGTNLFTNGDFETGDLTSWTIDGVNGPPVASGAQVHGGAFSALLGNVSGGEPLGDSAMYQTIIVPAGGASLSFWSFKFTTDSITFDWQDAYVEDNAGALLATIFHTCVNQGWTQTTFDLTPWAGTAVRIRFLVHQDGFGDDTAMYVDDVKTSSCSPFTITGTDVNACQASTAYCIGIAPAGSCPPITVSPATAPNGTVGIFYTQTFTASGGVAPYTFSSTGTLPPGLTLVPSTGVLSGTPTTFGTFGFGITATDVNLCPGTRVYSVTITSPCVGNGFVNVANAPLDAYGSGAASDGGYAYFAGGYSFSASASVNQLIRYDPVANSWTSLANMPQALGMPLAANGGNGKLYMMGGTDATTGTAFNNVQIYDIATNTWSTGTVMPDLRAFASGGYYNGKIYVIGGYNTGNISPAFLTVWAYDIAGNSWNTALTPIPAVNGFGGAASGIINGKIYVAGGRDSTNTVINTTWIYDIAGDSWIAGANLPAADNVPASAVVNGQLWVMGGGNPFGPIPNPTAAIRQPNLVTTTSSVEIYDPTSNSWASGPALTQTLSFPSATQDNIWTVVYGGYNGSTTTAGTETIFHSAPFALPATLPGGAVGTPYSQSLTGGGGLAPYTFAVTAGSLPPGLSMDAAGNITGTPTTGGTFNFTVTVTDSNGCTGTTDYSIVITGGCPLITVLPATLPDGIVGTAYSQTVSGSGGTAPYTFAVTTGALPTGLSLNPSTGAITGTPTATGPFSFTITATDANLCTGATAYILTIDCPVITVLPATLPDGSVTTAYSQTVSASGGTAPYTFAVSAGALPTGLSLNPSTGAITGTPTVAGPFSFDITATDANVCDGSTSYTVNINAGGQVLRFFTIQPCRLIDTRRVTGTWGGPPLQAATFRDFPLDGQCGIPADAVAVSANMTAVLPTAGGDLRAFPTGDPMPSSSVINFNAGGIRANNIIVPLTGTPIGSMTIRCDMPSGSTNFLFDANGYFAFVSQ